MVEGRGQLGVQAQISESLDVQRISRDHIERYYRSRTDINKDLKQGVAPSRSCGPYAQQPCTSCRTVGLAKNTSGGAGSSRLSWALTIAAVFFPLYGFIWQITCNTWIGGQRARIRDGSHLQSQTAPTPHVTLCSLLAPIKDFGAAPGPRPFIIEAARCEACWLSSAS